MNRRNFAIKMAALLIGTSIAFTFSNCKKLVDVAAPTASINTANVYTNDATAAAVLTGIYTQISSNNSSGFRDGSGFNSISLYTALSSDELTLYNTGDLTYSLYYQNALISSPTVGSANYWNTIYPLIYTANSAIEGLNSSKSLTASVKSQLLGEAKFMRAFFYFYLVNLYGDVPLIINSDWSTNAGLPRTAKNKVYEQIVADLKEAQNSLSEQYLKADALTTYATGMTERVRPTKWAATALLARVLLYTGDWAGAETQASIVINNSSLYQLVGITSAFVKNNQEAIWQLPSVGATINSNTGEGRVFVLPTTGPGTVNPVYLSSSIVNGFEANDLRKTNWVNSVTISGITYYYPFKYKIGAINTTPQEYSSVFRLAEQYLIRAEARAQQNNISGAQSDLNAIRSRAGLLNTNAGDKASLLNAIMQERRVELFTEWGHRWLDLRRTGAVDSVMTMASPKKGGTWASYKALYPLPSSEIQRAPQLLQNPGYN